MSKDSQPVVAFVCPSCRIVFSVPQGMDGHGVDCPGCAGILTVPAPADRLSELGAADLGFNRAGSNGRNLLEEDQVNRLTRMEPEWEDFEDEIEGSYYGLKLILPVVLVSLFIVCGITYFLIFGKSSELDDVMALTNSAEQNETRSIESDDDKVVFKYDPKNEEYVSVLEEFLTELFAAKTVDELLPLVYPAENIKAKMIEHYKGERISQSPFKNLISTGTVPNYPGILNFKSDSQDYSRHTGWLRYTEEGILLDWESYVGYSDMLWAELAEKRPTDPFQLRVIATQAHYYNEEFIDDVKWQSVSLSNPREDEPIYGYVLRGSATIQRLFNFGLSVGNKYILEVRFPEGAKQGDQVIIDRIVADGWVIQDEE